MTTYVTESKVYWKSKTFWANVVALLGALASALAGEFLTAGTLTVASVGNIILRFITKHEVDFKE